MTLRFCCYFEGDEVCDEDAAYEITEPDMPDPVDACLRHGNEIRAECETGEAVGYVIRSLAAS